MAKPNGSMGGMDRGTWIFLVAAVVAIGGLAWARFLREPAPVPEAFDPAVTLEAALLESENSGKPVLALAMADWCPACQTLKRGALASSEVSESIAARTVPVYLDLTNSNDPAAAEASAALKIRFLPTLLLLEDGQEISRLERAYPAARVLDWLDRFAGTQPTEPRHASSAGG